MVEMAHWDDIALGVATPGEARAMIRSSIDGLTEDRAYRIYEALRAWTWKALNERRRDPDLREWHDIIRSTDALFAKAYPVLAGRVATLADLVYESVVVAEAFGVKDVLERPYIQALVELLHACGPATLGDLAAGAGLPVGNIKQVLNMMSYSGLVTCIRQGGSMRFALSSTGWRAADALREAREPRSRKERRPQKQPPPAARPRPSRAADTSPRLSKEPSHEDRGRALSRVGRHGEAGLLSEKADA